MTDAQASGPPITSLNAIKLSAREVATTFVAPPAFDTLLHADNAILTGPRGSGKTTLLKMMQSEALENWIGPNAEAARESVRAVGVFIGSDRTWNEQLAMPGPGLDEASRRALATAAFTTHVARSLVDSMDYRVRGNAPRAGAGHRRVVMPVEVEAELGRRLSGIFKLPHAASSIPAVKALLVDRLVDIGMLRNRLQRVGTIPIPDWADLEFVSVSDAAAETFNDLVGEPNQKWALLFDELELAPEGVVEALLGALRGAQPRLLFKLSLAPAHAQFQVLDEENAPVPGQDYEHVPLTYARKLPALQFAKALVRATLESSQGGPSVSPERLLGSGRLDSREDLDPDAPDSNASAYAPGTPLHRTMRELAERDDTFAAYLASNSIDLDHMDRLPADVRASRVRKVRNIVVVREYYRDEQGRRRSRKNFALYTGADSILSLPDGNPRMIIALVRQLFPSVTARSAHERVPQVQQNAAIASTLQRFSALLEAQQAENIDGRPVGLMDLLDEIGGALATRLVEDPFNDNVRLTLRIPRRMRPEIRKLLIRAMNTGALIHVPPRESDGRLPSDLTGRQFRLSHLLACKYGLPIHLTPAVSLDDVLPSRWKSPTAVQIGGTTLGSIEALDLFSANEQVPSSEGLECGD